MLKRGKCCNFGCLNCPYRDVSTSGVFTPRDYQQSSVQAFWKGTKERKGQNPLLCLPTGAGKTIVIAEILRGILEIGYRAIVLARSRELVKQNHDKFSRHLPDADSGIYCAGLARKECDPDIIFATVQSIYQKGQLFGKRQLIIVDEAHEIPTRDESQYQVLLESVREQSPNAILLGLTASPYRLDGGVIHGANRQFDYVAHSVPLKKLIDDGYLTRPQTIDCESVNLDGVKKSAGDFNKSEVENRFLSLGDTVSDQIVSASNDKNTKSVLVFASGVTHAESIKNRIASHGYSAELITGETLPLLRQTSIDEFDKGKIRFLVSVDTLTQGFDCTRVDHIAVCRSTESPGLFYQICGRGFRLHEGKDVCWVQDFGGNIDRHGPIDSPTYGINTIKVKSDGGSPPQKACPSCFELLPASATTCSKCGLEFPRELNIQSRSSRHAILAEPRWYDVDSVSYKRWSGKGGKPDTMRVDYCVSIDGDWLEKKVVSEWVCLEHEGFARMIAMRWWVSRSSLAMPSTIDEALTLCNEGITKTPSRVLIHRDGAYDRIDQVEFVDVYADEDDSPF